MDSEQIIKELGGPSAVALICDVRPQAVSQWYGVHPITNKPRQIPKARLMYLKVVKRSVFARLEKQSKAKGQVPS